jgi:hypothetical protein
MICWRPESYHVDKFMAESSSAGSRSNGSRAKTTYSSQLGRRSPMANLQEQLAALQTQVDAIAAFLIGDSKPHPRKSKPSLKPKSKGTKPWTPARRKAHSKAIRAGQAKAKRVARKVAKMPARRATAKKTN